jgi:hypothetical protein
MFKILKIRKIVMIGMILTSIAQGQQMKNPISVQGIQPEVNSKQSIRLQMHEMMNKMHAARDMEERRAIVRELREVRKNRHVETQFKMPPVTKSVTQTKYLLSGEKTHLAPMSHQVEPSQLYQIPFASTGNRIELTVANASERSAANLKIEAVNLPKWLGLSLPIQNISNIKPNEENPVEFVFSVDKSAPVNTEQTISFTISTPTGEQWSKQIRISITAPERYELFQNYPNPFNPSTIINYQLPTANHVTLKIYNVLGQGVTTLVDGEQLAGYHEAVWDAISIPSGVYYYQIHAGNFTNVKKMMMLR